MDNWAKAESLDFIFVIAIALTFRIKKPPIRRRAPAGSFCLFGGGRNEALVRCHHDVLTTSYPHSLQIAGFYQFIRFAAPPGRIFTLIPGY